MSDTLEETLRSLLRGKYSSLSITFNEENAPNYQTVADYMEHDTFIGRNWATPTSRERAIETNSIWTIHLDHPLVSRHPDWFYTISGATLLEVLEAAFSQ